MANNRQRKNRQRRRRAHAARASVNQIWRRRAASYKTGDRSWADAYRLAEIAVALRQAPLVSVPVREYWAERVAYALLWDPTNTDALDHFVAPDGGLQWRCLAAALDRLINSDEAAEYGASAVKLGQRRMLDLAAWCDYAARHREAS